MNGDQNSSATSLSASSKSPFSALSSTRTSPLPPTTTISPKPNTTSASALVSTATPNATVSKPGMAASAYLLQSHAFRSPMPNQSPYPLSMGAINPFDRESAKPVGTPFASNLSPVSSVLIRFLPVDTTEEKLRLMAVFSQELIHVEILTVDQSEDAGYRSAILKFKTPSGAQQAKDILNGKSIFSNNKELLVEILSGSPTAARRYPVEPPVSAAAASSATSSTTSSNSTSRQPSRFNGAFPSLEKISPPLNGSYGAAELPNPESNGLFSSIFSPQSPIGNHLSDRTRISGKAMINNDSAEDDETRELLKDPVAYAENGAAANQGRRATAPHLPISRMASLSLNTSAAGPASLPPYGHPSMTPISAHGNTMSPTVMNSASHSMNYQLGNQHYGRHNFPPVNPADQNPPCNTLYVGNLPIDTSEEELKAMFSKQRGYKRLCFRTKQNGPMCFVEFEDVSFATKALHELYGHPLHNSVKGGIRLSFSKNPLGVRSGQTPGQAGASNMAGMNNLSAGSGNGFTTANGPPPGLAAPPGLSMGRLNYGGSAATPPAGNNPYNIPGYSGGTNSPWNNTLYNGAVTAGGSPSVMANSSTSSSFPPPYMMGR